MGGSCILGVGYNVILKNKLPQVQAQTQEAIKEARREMKGKTVHELDKGTHRHEHEPKVRIMSGKSTMFASNHGYSSFYVL